MIEAGRKLSLDEMHQVLLDVFDSFDSFCRENDIPYILIAGSALGAIRHHGFIPWDDDLDVAMMREDYNRFLELWSDSEQVELKAPGKNDSYIWMTSRLCDRRTICQENLPEEYCNGIFMDIFPLDYVSESSFFHKITVYGAKALKGIYLNRPFVQNAGAVSSGAVRRLLGRLLFSGDEVSNWRRFQSVFNTVCPSKSGKRVALLFGAYSMKECFPAEWLFPSKLVEFEGRQRPVPQEVHLCLTKVYGDYMSPVKDVNHVHGLAVWR